jgi:long-chain acyl-CoA synthetase
MNPVLSQCPHQNDDIVLSDLRTQLNFIELKTLTDECAAFFAAIKARVVASRLDNSIAWVVLDLALITHMTLLSQTLYVYELDNSERPLHPGTQKITFTSGSTGQPKGVCLSLENQLTVAQSLTQRIGLTKPVHMTILPFPVLLENVAGLYAPLLAGGKIVVLPSEQIGFSGASLKNPKMLLASMTNINPHSMILVPELLKVLVAARSQGWSLPSNLTFIAVGGAHTPKALLQQAKELGLPVYQGYGLSEAGSVVALNTEDQDGSVGKVLEHIQYRVVNAELQIKGPLFLGYLGLTAHNANCWLSTGDLVEVERERVFIAGREKNLIISSLGRNISPEWPETELVSASWLVQCVVFGEAKPNLCALIYAMPVVPDVLITQHIATINQSLPEYAQIKHYLRLSTPLSVEAGLLTANGRPKRAAIEAAFKQQIEMLYSASPSAQQRLA